MKGMYRKCIHASSERQHKRDLSESRGKRPRPFCEWNKRDGSRSCINGSRSRNNDSEPHNKISDFGGPMRVKVVPRRQVRNCSLISRSTYQEVQDFHRKSMNVFPFHYFILEFTLDELSIDGSAN